MKNEKIITDLSAMSRRDLEENYIKLSTQLNAAQQQISWLEEQFRLSRAQRFGASSEQCLVDFNQMSLFNEAEFIQAEEDIAEEPSMAQIAPPVKKKKKGHKEKLVSALPKETIEYTLSPEEQVCPACGEALREMKKQIRRELCVIPAKVYVKEHIQYLYTCQNCQKTGDANPVQAAHAPQPLFRNSLASPSLLASIIKRKYVDAMPLYRQEQEFHRNGLKLSRQTMANWVIQGAVQYLIGLYESMREDLLAMDIVHSDDTRLEVLHEPGREATADSFMWLYCSGKAETPIILYQYAPTRSGSVPKAFLNGFQGYLQTDGYAGYHGLLLNESRVPTGITPLGCFAHAKRKYTDAFKALPKAAQADPHTNVAKGIWYCDQIFRLEREWAEYLPEDREAARREKMEPLLAEYFAWVKRLDGCLLKGKLSEAITYSINQESSLRNFMLDGRLECSNNRAERYIKPFVIGRKNFLFCNTPDGAYASAVLYSIVETAKANGLDPFRYLEYLFEELSQEPVISGRYLKSLLPYSPTLPENCKAIANHAVETTEPK